jgi:hypothetical protein
MLKSKGAAKVNTIDLRDSVRKQGRRVVTILLAAVVLAANMLLLPVNPGTVFAQGVPDACKNDAGGAVVPNAAAGVGAWLLVLNFNHAPSATTTTGCMVMTTGLNPQQVSRTLIACQIVNNTGSVQVGSGAAAFDGNFSINCPGVTQQGKKTLENFTVWGRGNFAKRSANYPIVQSADIKASAAISPDWHVQFTSRYGSSTFTSADGVTNLMGRDVSFASAVAALQGIHSLNGSVLAPRPPISAFDYHFDQPITIGAAGQPWTLYEVIVDPPGGCCKS